MVSPRLHSTLSTGLALLLGVLGGTAIPARADIVPTTGARSLGTSVSCSGGNCNIRDGFSAGGKNLYHRFNQFDTRNGINAVEFFTGNHGSVIVGVIGTAGTFIDAPISLSSPASLMWLSPGGISITGQGSFQNVTSLGLTTQTGLRMGGGDTWFDVYNTTAQNLAANSDFQADPVFSRSSLKTDLGTLAEMGLNSSGAIALNPAQGVELTVASNLLIDSGLNQLSANGASLRAGTASSPRGTTSVALYGNTVVLGGSSIEAAADGIVNLQADQSLSLSDSAVKALKIGLRGGTIDVAGSELKAPRGLIQATAETALNVTDSLLDVAPRTQADVEGPGLGFITTIGSTTFTESQPAILSLATTGSGSSLNLSGSTFDASSLVKGIPGSEASPQNLIAGNIFVRSEGSLISESSTFKADADTDDAGQVSFLALNQAGTLQINNTNVSANSPNGSGDIVVYGAGPVEITGGSTLTASTTGLDFDQENFQTFFNPAGEVKIASQSVEGIRIEDSTLVSRYDLKDPSTFSRFKDTLDPADDAVADYFGLEPPYVPLGGLVQLTSAGTVDVVNSSLDASSSTGVGGRVEVNSLGGDGVKLFDSSLLATVSGPLPADIEIFNGGFPPERGEGFQTGRIDVVSVNGITLDGSAQGGGTTLDASNIDIGFWFDPDTGFFEAPISGEINLIAGGQDDSGITLRNTALDVSSPVGQQYEPFGFPLDSEGGTILIAVADGSGGISKDNVTIDVSGDQNGNLVEILPTNSSLTTYLNKEGQNLETIKNSELGTASDPARSLQQLGILETSLLEDQVDIIIDARDPSNVTVTVVDRSLASTAQANTTTTQDFDLTTVEGRSALEALLADLDRDDENVLETLFTNLSLQDEALASDVAAASNEALVDSGLSAGSASSLEIDAGSGFEDAPTAEERNADASFASLGVLVRPTALTSPMATTSLLAGEARSAADVYAFAGNDGPAPKVPTLDELQGNLQARSNAGQSPTAILRLSFSIAPTSAEVQAGNDLALYSVLADGSPQEGDVDVVLVLPEGQPQGWRSRIDLSSLKELLRDYYTALAEQRTGLGQNGSAERRLFDLIIRPALPSLEQAGIGNLIISADPSLIDIPFNALHDGREYLGERFSLAVTPSLAFTNLSQTTASSVMQPGRRMHAGASTFINGLTPLPMVEQELSRLAEQQQGQATTLLNHQFTPVTFSQAFADSGTRQVHIASHAEIAAGKEKAPRIYTSDEVIGLRELGRLRQRSTSDALDLVTLSACRSALNAAELELGFAGLAVQMGARSAIGTKWYVDDTAMSSFFVMFYDQLRRGQTKAEALRTTQRAFASGQVRVEGTKVVGPDGSTLLANLPESYQHRYGRGFTHPYYWAGVQLVGSPW